MVTSVTLIYLKAISEVLLSTLWVRSCSLMMESTLERLASGDVDGLLSRVKESAAAHLRASSFALLMSLKANMGLRRLNLRSCSCPSLSILRLRSKAFTLAIVSAAVDALFAVECFWLGLLLLDIDLL